MSEETLPVAPVTVVPENQDAVAKKPRAKYGSRVGRFVPVRGAGKGGGKKIPPPASPKKAEKMVKKLVADSVAAIVQDKEAVLTDVDRRQYDEMSGRVRAQIMALLGPDVEAARSLFADEMLSTARLLVQRIAKEASEIPHSNLAFTMSCLVDKSEALRNKQASSAAGAKVAIQINNYGDGAVDRAELMAQLHPELQAEKAG